MNNIVKVLLDRYHFVSEHYGNVMAVFLNGSQNYNLDYEGSDIDCKAIVLPGLEDIVLNKKAISKTIVLDNNEHIDVKDIRVFIEILKKQNISYLEVLFTKYMVVNTEYKDIIDLLIRNREKIARYDNYASINCLYGMILEKYKALEHRYPSLVDKIDKYGYDPKQLHHIIRLTEFMERFINGEDFGSCLVPSNTEYLINVKKGLHTLEEAREIAKENTNRAKIIKNEYIENNSLVIDTECELIFKEVLLSSIKLNLRKEMEDR